MRGTSPELGSRRRDSTIGTFPKRTEKGLLSLIRPGTKRCPAWTMLTGTPDIAWPRILRVELKTSSFEARPASTGSQTTSALPPASALRCTTARSVPASGATRNPAHCVGLSGFCCWSPSSRSTICDFRIAYLCPSPAAAACAPSQCVAGAASLHPPLATPPVFEVFYISASLKGNARRCCPTKNRRDPKCCNYRTTC
ncbi:hypothetical protein DIPPA_16960 [Diplonema papillatum]|nr:hypothetical protein DIPPA_16960 [Diplonema papillatum]